ncbi:MAG: trimethylamine methyltransferase family protein [Candidatus Saccharibacteria bacterium]|nr:trimethylamine methyltransferase family protein [Pseudorhodobacter sp.]
MTDPHTEATAGRSRRRGHAAPRSTGPSLIPLPRRLENPFAPLKSLSDQALSQIIAAAYRILDEGGIEFRSRPALDLMRRNGARVTDDAMVRLDPDLVRHFCAMAPQTFTLHSRNPAKHVHMGGNVLNFCTANGAPNAHDRIRGRRYGDYATLCEIIRLNNALGAVHISGGEVVEPVDIPVHLRPLHMAYAHITNGDLVYAARGIGRQSVMDGIEMTCLARGIDKDRLAVEPSLYAITNSNSPRRLDEELLDGAMTAAAHGQAVIATPFTLSGAMAPITLAGALALQTAEAMAIVVLTQMVRPGAPVVYGGFTSNVDMRTGSPAFGTPEYVRATLAGGQIARALGLPYRTSSVNSSTSADAQATYETQFSLFAAVMGHGNFINHATGWLEGGLVTSHEKIVIDTELLRGWAASLLPIEAGPDDLAVDTILAVPPGGHFFGTAHTMTRFETAFHAPLVSDWSSYENWKEKGERDTTVRATEIWQKVLAEYEPPSIDPGVDEALRDHIARRTRAGAP